VLAYLSGSELNDACKVDNSRCASYIGGIMDYMALDSYLQHGLFCPPPNMSVRQAIMAFQKLVGERPALLDSGAAGVVGLALNKTFPCKNSNRHTAVVHAIRRKRRRGAERARVALTRFAKVGIGTSA